MVLIENLNDFLKVYSGKDPHSATCLYGFLPVLYKTSWCIPHDQEIQKHPKVASTRQQGQIFALDLNIKMERYGNLRDQLFNSFMSKGVCLRPLGNTIYILAPYIITDVQLQKIYTTITETLDALV